MSRQASTREVHSSDLPTRVLDPIEDPASRDTDVIVSTETLTKKDFDELAFMEESVVVHLHRGREKYAPEYEMLGVNGRTMWVQVGKNTRMPRKFLEVLARSQPMDIRTESGLDPNADAFGSGTVNRIHRSLSANFSFSIVEDKSPMGVAWLAKVMREN